MAEDYFSNPRPEVRALIPASARVVIDVGCGAGEMGAALKKERPGIEVRGIEVNAAAASRAAGVLDAVIVRSAEGDLPGDWPAPDCVVFADVLEHLVDPLGVLQRWRARLREGAQIVVSLPNIANWSIVDSLRRGRWDYTDSGILDRTHLRFFTTRTAIELVTAAGFKVETVRHAVPPHLEKIGHLPGWPLVLLGVTLEHRGWRLPSWLSRILDSRSRQTLIRAEATPVHHD